MDCKLLASYEICDIPVKMLALLVRVKKLEKLETAVYAFYDYKIKKSVVGKCLGSSSEAAAIIAGITDEAEKCVKRKGLTVIYRDRESVFDFLCDGIKTTDIICALSGNKRIFLDCTLLCADLSIHTHGALIDGKLVSAFDKVKLTDGTFNLVVKLRKSSFVPK